ncbi:MlaD family protein [Nonomuraea sp. NPDC049152]|uniref:MlaD family protein n=1 Tax=Nonomuraea sp. NPDC049152 TaxID=3154350 RepID=UPI003407955F
MILRLKLLAFAVVTVVATAYTLVAYAGIGADVFDPAYRVRVDLADVGGLFDRAEVTYRGVRVGRVEELRPTMDGAGAVLRIDAGVLVPRDGLSAVVANRSGVGEQYLDLRPSGTAPPYLKEGDVIAREHTRLPITTAALLRDADRLLASVNPADVATVVEELEHAFGRNGPHLGRLFDASDELLSSAEDVLPETKALIGDGRPSSAPSWPRWATSSPSPATWPRSRGRCAGGGTTCAAPSRARAAPRRPPSAWWTAWRRTCRRCWRTSWSAARSRPPGCPLCASS